MAMLQMNKRFGLMKLKKIAGPQSSRWFVSPHFTIRSPEQFRLERTMGRPRLLVRTDEAGRSYKRLSWQSMPRFDMKSNGNQLQAEMGLKLHEEILKKKQMGTLTGTTTRYEKARIIIHPTWERERMQWTGCATIASIEKHIVVSIYLGTPGEHPVHRSVLLNPYFQFKLEPDSFNIIGEDAMNGRKSSQERAIAVTVRDFVVKGLRDHQLKLARGPTIYFVTWKNEPEKLEFYDMTEYRQQPDKPKREAAKPQGAW